MNRPLAEVFRYNRWATLRLLEACRTLGDEQLDVRAGSRPRIAAAVGDGAAAALRAEDLLASL